MIPHENDFAGLGDHEVSPDTLKVAMLTDDFPMPRFGLIQT